MAIPKKLSRLRALDKILSCLDGVKKTSVPPKGWVHEIRNALAMEGRQLGTRMGVTGSRITRIEQDEAAGAITIKSMHRAAEAMGCKFVYAIVPADTDRLEDLVRTQAIALAEKLVPPNLPPSDRGRAVRDMAEDMIRELPRALWDA